MKNQTLEQMVIDRNPEARMTYQVVKQLHRCLPIHSFEELAKALQEGVVVDDQRLHLKMMEHYIPEGLFPIKDENDLVVKITGATRIALTMMKSGSTAVVTTSAVQEIMKTGLGPVDEQQSSIPAGHFPGPSLYGYKLSKHD